MSASPSHPVAVLVDLKAGSSPKSRTSPRLPPLCDVRVPISATSSITRFQASHTSRVYASVGVFSSGANRLSSGLKRSKQACRRELPVSKSSGTEWC